MVAARTACHGLLIAELAAGELLGGGDGAGWRLGLLGIALGELPPGRAAELAALVVCERRCGASAGCLEPCMRRAREELLHAAMECC